MSTIVEIARMHNGNVAPVIGAIKALALRGRVSQGVRLWTPAEVSKILSYLNKAK